MSIDSLIANPVIVDELKGVFSGGGSGIQTLASPDGNLQTAVVGTEGQVSLSTNITVQGDFNLKGKMLIDGNPGGYGTVLTSQASIGAPIWLNPPKIYYYGTGNFTTASGQTSLSIVNISSATDILAGKPFYVDVFFTTSGGTGGFLNMNLTANGVDQNISCQNSTGVMGYAFTLSGSINSYPSNITVTLQQFASTTITTGTGDYFTYKIFQ